MAIACALANASPRVQPAGPLFEAAFEGPASLKPIEPIAHPKNFEAVPDPDDDSNNTLRVTIPEGQHYGGSFSVPTADVLDEEPTRIFMRYRLRFDSTWNPQHSGKLPGFGGTYNRAGWGGKPSDGTNGWSARGMFGPIDDQGRTPVGSYIYHADMVENDQTYGNSEWWDIRLERERWYTIEQEIQIDSIGEEGGNADGWIRAWVDGQLVFDRKRLHVRDNDALCIERVWANFYYGGKTPAPTTMSLLIDDFAAFRTRDDTQDPSTPR